MVSVEIQGGLGNQMFQYSLARELKTRGREVYLDSSWFTKNNERSYLLGQYNISIPCLTSEIRAKIRKNRIYNVFTGRKAVFYEEGYEINSKVFEIDDVSISGYWQSEKYFANSFDVLKREFTLQKGDISEKHEENRNEIVKTNSVSVHIRRGDYLSDKNIKSRGNICTSQYYRNAIHFLEDRLDSPEFFFFSDDIEWVENIYSNADFHYVQCSENPCEDLWLMSLCKHHILANSSFSWWGAWLNSSDNQYVIAPKTWKNGVEISNIYCDGWIKM